MNECIIGIGSNIDAEKNITEMLELLKQKVNVIIKTRFLKYSRNSLKIAAMTKPKGRKPAKLITAS